MINYIIRRLLIAVPVLLLMVMATFALINAVPGGPFDASGQKKMPDHIVVIMERQYGLDKPLYEQFGRYLVKLAQGDMGPLLQSRVRNVNDVVKDTFPVSFQLGIMAVVLGIAIGIPAGIIAALRHNTVIDYTATFFAVLFASIPNLVLAPLLILIFALSLGWFPIAFWGAEPPLS